MPCHWLDANVFLQAYHGPYGFEIAPGFWAWIDESVNAGSLRSCRSVYNEIVQGGDELAKWAKERKNSGLFAAPDKTVQQYVTNLNDYVGKEYILAEAAQFLAGADPWIIAHAAVNNGKVVTHETRVGDDSSKAKIPNVCQAFGVRCTQPYKAFKSLGLRLRFLKTAGTS